MSFTQQSCSGLITPSAPYWPLFQTGLLGEEHAFAHWKPREHLLTPCPTSSIILSQQAPQSSTAAWISYQERKEGGICQELPTALSTTHLQLPLGARQERDRQQHPHTMPRTCCLQPALPLSQRTTSLQLSPWNWKHCHSTKSQREGLLLQDPLSLSWFSPTCETDLSAEWGVL